MGKRHLYLKRVSLILLLLAAFGLWMWMMGGTALGAANPGGQGSSLPWWAWVLILLVMTFIMGIVAVLGGVGGGVIFVPIVSGFFPFHLDFVRCAGLLVALSGALSAGPGLLRAGMADLRLALPTALIASSASILGAMIGLALPTRIVQIALGITILGIVVIMLLAKKSEYPDVKETDGLARMLGIQGTYLDISTGQEVHWKVHRTPLGLGLFVIIGIMAGMFGLGAGWANVPVLNLLMGAPLKVSVATSKFLLSITDTSAAWIYINSGAMIPLIVVPSLVGIMLGSWVGVPILTRTKPTIIRYIVIGLLTFSGVRAFLKGLGI
ncbi:MAG: sulfite exporter TauE/SafE family protein [Desulfobaccales bacterium]